MPDATVEQLVSQAMELMRRDHKLSRRAAAQKVGLAPSTLQYHVNGRSKASGANPGEQRAQTEIDGDTGTVTSPVSKTVTDPDTLMAELGIDAAEWDNPSIVVNRWGDPSDPSYQLKLALKRKVPVEFVTPAVHVPPVRRPTQPASLNRPTLTVVCGDQQAPFQDEALHELFLAWLETNRPEAGVLLGDTIDLPTISRHRDNPEWHQPVQACIDSGYRLLRDYVEASEGTQWTKLIGNHDERLRTELLNRAERLYGIRPAATEWGLEAEALGVRRLLHLDALGIELEAPNGGYEHAQVDVAPGVTVRHGWLTRNAAEASLKQIDYSLIVGHTHRQAVHQRTLYDQAGNPTTQYGVEAGCMCRVKGGLGYAVDPDWQPGFATVTAWPDGRFNIELARYERGYLYWREQRLG